MLSTNEHMEEMDEVESFCEFLVEKGLPSHIIRVIEDERISQRVIQYMGEADLATLFPAMGDRLHFRPILEMFKVS